jgi:hypothetical protein
MLASDGDAGKNGLPQWGNLLFSSKPAFLLQHGDKRQQSAEPAYTKYLTLPSGWKKAVPELLMLRRA